MSRRRAIEILGHSTAADADHWRTDECTSDEDAAECVKVIFRWPPEAHERRRLIRRLLNELMNDAEQTVLSSQLVTIRSVGRWRRCHRRKA